MSLNLNYKLLIKICSVVALGNMVANAFAVWTIWNGKVTVPVWGANGIAAYLFISSFLTGFLLCLLTTSYTRAALRDKKVLPLHWHLKNQTLIDQLPSTAFYRSFVLAILGAIMASITLLMLSQKKTEFMLFEEFFSFTLIYAATIAVAGSVICFYRSLVDGAARTVESSPWEEAVY